MGLVRNTFWGMLGCLVLLFLLIGQADSAAAADRRIQKNVDVIFVLDNSGSMIKNDPEFITKTVVINFLEGLDEEVRIGMVIFDTDARLIEPLSGITTAESVERFLLGLDMITYKGQFTNTPAGVERAVYELKTSGRQDAKKIVILLTDGIVDTGNKDQDLEAEKWLKETLTLECKKLGIRIFGVAFTEQADFRLMQTLAVNTDGEYFRAFTADEVESVFKKIDDIISKSAQAEPEPAPTVADKPKLPDEKAIPDTRPIETGDAGPAEKGTMLFPLILALVILAGLILIYFVFMRKKKTILIKPDPQKEVRPVNESSEKPMDPAELIDTENIISSESITFPLNHKSVSIGRDSSNDIVIPKESISSLHATIDYKNGYYYLEDHRSTNGTRLNEKPIKENNPVRLKSGDKIHFAIFEFRFLMHDLAPYGETVMIQKDTKLKFEP
ncbi:MAG: FHA domain-containing protein [Deltaproteobacteria bacterium]|nr:FHA domain-containing protein [Deltaproteobacteria bacterium]